MLLCVSLHVSFAIIIWFDGVKTIFVTVTLTWKENLIYIFFFHRSYQYPQTVTVLFTSNGQCLLIAEKRICRNRENPWTGDKSKRDSSFHKCYYKYFLIHLTNDKQTLELWTKPTICGFHKIKIWTVQLCWKCVWDLCTC